MLIVLGVYFRIVNFILLAIKILRKKMQIILSSANQKKINEIRAILKDFEVLSYRDFLDEIEVIENGSSFEENAMLKARCIDEALRVSKEMKGDFLILADDSGLCVEALGGMPGIYSARFASIQADISDLITQNFTPPQKSATDEENNLKLIESLKKLGLLESRAFFVCVVAVCGRIKGERVCETFRGECEGKVILAQLNSESFGYDPLFVPKGYSITMDQIAQKNHISHRFHALKQLRTFLRGLQSQ